MMKEMERWEEGKDGFVGLQLMLSIKHTQSFATSLKHQMKTFPSLFSHISKSFQLFFK